MAFATAFQKNAFQNNAFQIASGVVPARGDGAPEGHTRRKRRNEHRIATAPRREWVKTPEKGWVWAKAPEPAAPEPFVPQPFVFPEQDQSALLARLAAMPSPIPTPSIQTQIPISVQSRATNPLAEALKAQSAANLKRIMDAMDEDDIEMLLLAA